MSSKSNLDFVDWCDHVLTVIIDLERASSTSRYLGVDIDDLGSALWSERKWRTKERTAALTDAERALKSLGWMENGRTDQHVRPTRSGKDHVSNPTIAWEQLCSISVAPEEEELIRAVNASSPWTDGGCSGVDYVPYEQLGNPDHDMVWTISRRIEDDLYLLAGPPYMANTLRSTYQGIVWETRRAFLGNSRLIDELVKEWETTTVEFKRELHTGTDNEKAELIKDLIGLANTKASGQRWLVIGFDDKTHEYHGPPSPKITQNHLENLLSAYTAPVITVRYRVVEYRAGDVGMIEVMRNPVELPYTVAKTTGGKKRIDVGQIFVRHGSQTEGPTPAELAALIHEANRAKRQADTQT